MLFISYRGRNRNSRGSSRRTRFVEEKEPAGSHSQEKSAGRQKLLAQTAALFNPAQMVRVHKLYKFITHCINFYVITLLHAIFSES